MARDPEIGNNIIKTVMEVKGDCSAGHAPGNHLELC